VRAYALVLQNLLELATRNETEGHREWDPFCTIIGKLAVEDYILKQARPAFPKRVEKIKIHSIAGDEFLQQVHFPFPVAKYVRAHHERWDGPAHPDGLKGEEISSRRPYLIGFRCFRCHPILPALQAFHDDR